MARTGPFGSGIWSKVGRRGGVASVSVDIMSLLP